MELSSTHDHVEDEAFVIVKAAPRISKQKGVTVCCAAIDRAGSWVRLYPVSFRYLDERQKFARWDRIKYRWRRPRAALDTRSESRRIDDKSVEILGSLPPSQRSALINRTAVTSLREEALAGRSLAMLRAEILHFWYEKRTAAELAQELAKRANVRAQGDMFQVTETVAEEAAPFVFKYRYRDADQIREGSCQDWETEATFLKRRRELATEQEALDWMLHRFGQEWPQKGMMLAMGTHGRFNNTWLINGIVRVDPERQPLLI